MKKAAYVGDHGRGGRGLDDCAVVLVDRIGCRSRQAARGPRRPWVNSPWCSFGSSPRTRERQGANKCRKPGSRWQSRETGGGFPPNGKRISESGPGSTCRWKALCAVEDAPFDEGATEPELAPRYAGSPRRSNLAGARQRASEVGRQPGTRLKTPWPSSPAHAVLCSSLREEGSGRYDRSWRHDVNRVST